MSKLRDKQEVFRIRDWSIGVKTKGDVKGGGTEKPEKEKEIQRNIAILYPPLAGVYSGTSLQASRKGCEEGSTLSTALQGDQAWKPDSYTSCGLQARGETLTHLYPSI